MTPRLLAICSCVGGGRLADIGSDHAYIPIYLLQKSVITGALAMDINEGPLRRAQAHIDQYMMRDRIETRLSDGLKKLLPGEADEVVIAGMGGILICDILEARRELWDATRRFILQPMTAAEELRKYLESHGFYIEKETLAKEDRKLYQVLSVRRGTMKMRREADYYISPPMLASKSPLVGEFVEKKIVELERTLAGLAHSERTDVAEKERYTRKLLDELHEIQGECAQWKS